MGKYTPPKEEQTFDQVEKPVVETKEEVHLAEESEKFDAGEEPAVAILNERIDKFIMLLADRRNVPSENYGKEQLEFMAAMDELIKQPYDVFSTVMDKLVNRVRLEPKAFSMDRLFVHTMHPEVKVAKNDIYLQKHIALLSAIVTLGRNLKDRQRVGRQVDIVMLTKGYHPKVAQNLQNYFNRVYS
ncbi:hypothetical protein [Vibrio phage 5 TSL-2019]|nr:hypothetical protein [Vibrio phage 5 TSL-2019]